MLHFYKWLCIFPVLALSTALIGTTIVFFSLLRIPPRASQKLASFWARLNAAVCLMHVDVLGLENLVGDQSYILVVNHLSLVDIFVLYGFLRRDLKWVIKSELKFVPFLGQACMAMGNIFVDRKNTDRDVQAISRASASIKQGDCVIFFPEGTRSRDAVLGPFKKGAFRMAKEHNLPLVPITLHDTHLVLPSDSINWRPGKVTMEIHRAILISTDVDPSQLSNRVREIIANSLELMKEKQLNL
ncbi:MAG: 1-acyl-sn-glycerol-3-phosphate acyltransferase [Gammaproteobacteria bacterium]|nr:1-acyl-sn-glycerol-3-phosphate acyltransferase [Gammaproteobacteria bacterium]